jgi:predicted dehydrogenase
MGANYPGVSVFADHRDVLDSDVDAVVIATPAHTHAELALEAIDAGKDLLVEKPFTLTVDDAELVTKEAAAADRILMVGHLLLYQPAIGFLKEYLKAGSIGWVATLYQDRLNLGTVRTVENALWSLGVHDVAAILYLAGDEPERVTTWGQRVLQPAIEDDMHLHMLFPDGTEGHVHSSWLWPEQRRRLTIVGTEGMVTYDEDDHTVRLHRRRVLPDLKVQDAGSEAVFVGDDQPLRRELSHFIECVENRTTPRSSGEASVPVIRVLEESARQLRSLATVAE